LSQTDNSQQAQGLDLSGQFGSAIFSVGTPQAVNSTRNTDATTASVTVTGLGALTSNDYLLSYNGGAYSLTRTSDGGSVALSGNGTAGNPLTADGLSIVLSGTPAAGDQFLIQPTATAASSLKVVLTDPSKIAAAGAVQASAANGNSGNAIISSGTTLDATNPNLLNPVTIAFTSATTYSINGGANQSYTNGGNIDFNGWEVQISGAPANGDVFTVKSNAGGTGDNRNALASAAQQSVNVLANGTVSVTGAVSALVTGLGSQAQQINTAQTAQAAVNAQALSSVQSISGVNLDEEAAKLLQWQQAYQAAAQALVVGNSLFTSLINAVNK
jgi:flagellar hook-associated protein 1 FlgK